MVWVQRIIWAALAVFSFWVVYVVFSGGLVDDEAANERDRQEAAARGDEPPEMPPSRGEMAYDRYLPGGRQNPGAEAP